MSADLLPCPFCGGPVRPPDPAHVDFEVWQDGMNVAGAGGPRAEAWRETLHYAAQYAQDGPVEIYEVTRRLIDPEAT